MARDMTERQFNEATKRHGFRSEGFLGYYAMDIPGGGQCCISVWNAGLRRRDQLAYLLQQKEKRLAEVTAKQLATS